MVDPVTVNRALAQPTLGSDVGTWNVPLNGNFGSLDTIVGGITTIGAVGGVSTTLNAAQLACGTISVTGNIASNAGLVFPAVQGWWSIENLTTGAGVVFVTSGAGEIICMPPGEITDIQINGVNARYRNLGRVGSYLDYAGSAVPTWVTQCSKPPYLNCDGSSFSAVTYPSLNAILGGTTLPDIRGTARYTLNQGTGRVTVAGSGIDGNTRFTIGGDQLMQSHNHGVAGNTGGESNTHQHVLQQTNIFQGSAGAPTSVLVPIGSGGGVPPTSPNTTGHNHAISLTSATAGGGVFQNMPPVTISGICMIRAG